MTHANRKLAALLTATLLTLGSVIPAAGGFTVFDPSNFAQNVLTATRTLEMINKQVAQLQNEARMLINMSKNLESLDYSALVRINESLTRIDALMKEAQGIAFDMAETERIFAERFPKDYNDFVSSEKLAEDARARWSHTMDAWRHTLRVQAEIGESLAADQELIGELVEASQSAVGALQAQQATNQLLALSTEQSARTQAMMAAQYRAQALDRARQAAEEERSRARFARFIGDGQAYTTLD